MKCERRDFLALLAAAGASPSMMGLSAFAEPQADKGSSSDPAAFDFWTRQIRAPSNNLGARGGTENIDPTKIEHRGDFLFHTKDEGFRLATSLGEEGLPEKGDIGVVVAVDAFRPSKSDHDAVNKAKCCSLRVDLQQAVPFEGLYEPMAWTSIASVFTANKRFTDPRDFNFDAKSAWGKLERVPLVDGVGFWSWNLFMEKQESLWARIMKGIGGGKGSDVLSAFGLPGIAKTALQAVDGLVGWIASRGQPQWLLKTVDTKVYATKAARDQVPGRAVALRKGQYVVTLGEHASNLVANPKIDLSDGLLVPSGTKDTDVKAAADEFLPDVTYVAFSVVTVPRSSSA